MPIFRLAKTRAEERTRKCHQAGWYVRKDTFTFTTNQYILFAYDVCPSTRNYKILKGTFFLQLGLHDHSDINSRAV